MPITNHWHHAENALRIVLRSQAKGNLPMVASLQQHLGRVQFQLGNTKKASKMAEKALKSISECSSEHPEITAHIYNLFSLVYEKEENTVRALEYLEKAIEQMKVWGMHSSTSDLEYYLFRLDELKNQSSNGKNECKLSAISQKVLLDNSSMTDEFIQELADELRKTPKTDILTRLELINLLIVACSKQMHYRSAKEYFDEANSIYSEHQSSNMVDAEQLDDKMMMKLFNMARSYHRQQQWDMCRSYLEKSLELVLKQKKEPMILPQIYYCMASTYAHQQEIDSAIVHYELAISAAKKRLPNDHPDVQLYCFQLQKYKNDVQEAYSKGYLPRKRV
jgi:tetratricopeptide (TPR) repeat protein